METKHITFYDRTTGLVVGELMTATDDQINQLINKGFKVVDVKTNAEIASVSQNMDTVGVSECIIGC